MNRKYIINTRDVCNMGGGQLFVLRRARHLRDMGYEVIVLVSIHDGNFVLKSEFGAIPIYYHPELNNSSLYISPRKSKTVIFEILKQIGEADEFLIESHTLQATEWGEIIASYLNAKHLCYLLAEPTIQSYRWKVGKRIFKQKLVSNEFWGCSSISIERIWGKHVEPNNFVNIGFDDSELVDKSVPKICYTKAVDSYCIATISRLEKTYIEPLIDASQKLASHYPSNHFDLIVAGGSSDKSRESYLFKKYKNNLNIPNNLNIIFTGFINKLGRDLFRFADVFVGMGTASINAISQGCLCINIDPSNNDMASGFFGTDTMNFAYTENGMIYSIYDKLEEAFNLPEKTKNMYISSGRQLYKKKFSITECELQLDNAIDNCSKVKSNSVIMPNVLDYWIFSMARMCVRAIRKLSI